MRNYRKYLVPFILIVIIVIGISKLDIQSVSKHDKTKNNTIIVENNNATSSDGNEENKDVVNSDKDDIVISETAYPDIKKESKDKKKKGNNNSPKNKNDLNSKKSLIINKRTASKTKGSVPDSKKRDEKADNSKKNKTQKDSLKKDNSEKDNYKKDSSKNNTSPTKEPVNNNYIKCNVTIDCSVLLSNMDKLDNNIANYVPKSGKLLEKTSIKVKKGATAYDVLTAVCKEKKIAYDAEYSSIYKTSYVKGIGHIYEKMAGDMSGWLYLVDDAAPNVGASAYVIKDGECVTWTYTCSGRAGS